MAFVRAREGHRNRGADLHAAVSPALGLRGAGAPAAGSGRKRAPAGGEPPAWLGRVLPCLRIGSSAGSGWDNWGRRGSSGFGKSARRVSGAPGTGARGWPRARLQLVQSCLTPSQLETLRMMSPVEKRSSRPKRAFLEGFWGKGNGGPCQPGTLAVRAGLQAPHRPQFLMKSWAHALLELSSFISAQCLLVFQIQVRAP